MSHLPKRRPQPSKPHVVPRAAEGWLTASGMKIDVSNTAQVLAQRRRETWQRDCWDYYDVLGEVKYGIGYKGSALSRLRLFVAQAPDDPDGKPIPAEGAVAAAAQQALDDLQTGFGHGSLLADYGRNYDVAGECYLVGLDGEGFSIRSVDEVTVENREILVHDGPLREGSSSRGGRKITDSDFIARLWRPHPRFGALPDSPLRGVLSSCEELVLLESSVRATLRSRMPAGVWVVPDSMTLIGPADDTQSQDDGQALQDPVLDAIQQHLMTPLSDESSPSSLVPYLLRVPDSLVEQVAASLVTFERTLDKYVDQRTERALRRLAQGLNLPVEVLLGISDVNHWNVWQISEDTFKAHIEPDAVELVNSLTEAYLWPAVPEATGAGLFIWYDASDFEEKPNRDEAANDAVDRNAITLGAYRRVRGFTDDDAPPQTDPDVEQAYRLVEKAPSLAQDPGIPALVEQIRAANSGTPVPDEIVAAAVPEAASAGPGARLGQIDRDLRARLLAAADVQVGRAIEKAGARIRSKANRDRDLKALLADVSDDDAAARAGREVIARLGLDERELVEDAFDPLWSRFVTWVQAAVADAAAVVGTDVPDLPVGEAADWFVTALVDLTVQRMYGDPVQVGNGEWDPTVTVPVGIVREAMARAGGAATLTAALPGGRPTASGVATGPVLLGQATQPVDGWTWVYGPFPRTSGFHPHEALDGTVFARWDDPRLVNTSGFPAADFFYPGDHPGCVCDAVPTLFEPQTSATSDVAVTPSGGPNRGPADRLWTAGVDPTVRVPFVRHPAGGYTADEGRWYIHREGDAWVVDEQIRDGDVLVAARVAVCPTLSAARTFIAEQG